MVCSTLPEPEQQPSKQLCSKCVQRHYRLVIPIPGTITSAQLLLINKKSLSIA